MDGGTHDFETRLIRLRLIVARAGEKDGLGWWESEALSDAGRFVLKRLFPRSRDWAAVELALEAAQVRHRRLVGERPGAVTLFALGDATERVIGAELRRLRGAGAGPEASPVMSSIEDLRSALRERGGLGQDDFDGAELQRMLVLQGIELAQLGRRQLADRGAILGIARTLAAAYTLSEPGSLTVPYFQMTEEDRAR